MKKRRKSFINLLIELCLIIFIYLSITINSNFSFIINKKIINNEEDINRYKDYKFVTLNMTKARESKYSIVDNNSKDNITYYIEYKKKKVLVNLKSSTVVTDKVDVMLVEDNEASMMFKQEFDDKDSFVNGYYTNINIKKNIDVVKYEFIAAIVIAFLCLVMMIFDFISIINPKIFDKKKVDL